MYSYEDFFKIFLMKLIKNTICSIIAQKNLEDNLKSNTISGYKICQKWFRGKCQRYDLKFWTMQKNSFKKRKYLVNVNSKSCNHTKIILQRNFEHRNFFGFKIFSDKKLPFFL